jgi:hypothetical protein
MFRIRFSNHNFEEIMIDVKITILVMVCIVGGRIFKGKKSSLIWLLP